VIAILLSAGKGTRMYPLTANTPKCLIDIGKGKTMLENQLDVLQACGIKKIYIIAGYRIEQVRAKLSGYPLDQIEVEIIHNPFYDSSNNIISLWLALLIINEPCISINGDDIFKPIIIEALIEKRGDIVMTIDRKTTYDADDMLVVTEGGQILDVGKDLDISKANGESVGIIKYSKKGVEIVRNTLDTMLLDKKNHHNFYLATLQKVMNHGFPVNYCEVEENDWVEIDFHPDVKDVREKVDYFVNLVT
jgi:L-glutamine-phosphate cytidylyltransferase